MDRNLKPDLFVGGLLWLHPSHRTAMRNIATLVALLLFGLLMSMAIPPLDAARGIAQYLPLHSLLETIAIVVAMMIFAISWNTYSKKLPANILLLGSVFLGVAMLDSEKIVRD